MIILVGLVLRVNHLWHIDAAREPFRLGGLFVAFAEQIAENHFRIPVSIPYYSAGGIPFAYPPLGFYLAAILQSLFPGRQILIANLLPPVLSSLALILSYPVFSKYFGRQNRRTLIALFAYAFLPNAFTNQIEAAGLAEAVGSLALIFYFASVFRFRRENNLWGAIQAGLALGLCVLSSPGSAVGAAGVSVLLAVVTISSQKMSAKSLAHLVLIALVGLVVSSPFWLSVIMNHGANIFISSVSSQYQTLEQKSFVAVLVRNLIDFKVTQWNGTFIWDALIFIGLVWASFAGNFFLVVGFLVLLGVPREYVWLVAFPASILFAHGVEDGIVVFLRPLIQAVPSRKKIMLGIFVFILPMMVMLSFQCTNLLIADDQWQVTPLQVERLVMVRELVPPDAKVITIGNDGLAEWAPYLLQREVINTPFGLEWQPAEVEEVSSLNEVLASADGWDEIYTAVKNMASGGQIYIVSTDIQRLETLNENGQVAHEFLYSGQVLQVIRLDAVE